ncbi:hypothetical protein ACFL6U_28675 [Planctomycetota bacterium]
MIRFSKFLLLLLITLVAGGGSASAEDIFIERPNQDSGPTVVWFVAYIVDIHAISSSDQSFTANVFYRLYWQDKALADPTGKKRVLPLEEVWHPHLQMINQLKVWETLPKQVEVSPDGKVQYQQRVWGNFSQPLDLHEFPLDRQSFAIQLVAIGASTSDVQLLHDPNQSSGIASRLSLSGWKPLGMEAVSATYAPLPHLPPRAGFVIRFDAERKVGYYLLKIVLPLMIIVMMSWLVFWINPTQAGVQISVSVTSMLTLIAYRFMISGFLPSISYLTRLDKLVLGATIMVFASLIEVIYAANLAYRDEVERALSVDRKSRVLFPTVFILLVVATLVI